MESTTMEERNWDELQRDCLVDIFAKVGIESLAESIQFVCKSWYDATFDPRCWTTLVFPNRICSDEFLKSVVGRSQRSATSIVMPIECHISDEGLLYISEECPALKELCVPYESVFYNNIPISELFGKWKNLEVLEICKFLQFKLLVQSISLHCKNFIGLACSGIISKEDATSIVECIPKIKFLNISHSSLSRIELMMILKGCRELEHLDVSGCRGLEVDDEILKLASHINSFDYDGTELLDWDIDLDSIRRFVEEENFDFDGDYISD